MRKNERESAAAQAALALMADANIAPTPDHFELFYSYTAGEKTYAGDEIGKMLSSGKSFTAVILHGLHQRASRDAQTQIAMTTVGMELADVLKSVLDNIEAAGREAETYGQTLSAASGQMGSATSPAAMQNLVKDLIGATQTMQARTGLLEAELERSSLEAAKLKTQLDITRKESLTDPLTEVHNRKAFDCEIFNAVVRANKLHEPLSLLMCDIDQFKLFNDTWGHQTGDHVLRLVAACLSQNVKGRDTVARYGGEEFAVILRQTALEDALSLAEQIRKTVERKKLVKRSTSDILGTITISVGVAEFAPGETEADFIGRADRSLYAAKHAGRNQVIGVKPAVEVSA